ncbi:MAG: YfcE family phosphodiesterase [Caldilineaceae bacterium]
MSKAEYLPPTRQLGEVAACVGLVSDTHYPLRCEALPPALFSILADVDLLLHAGDVGDLDILDQLSAIAPVIAVHGNDESDVAQQILPYQQVISIQGQRILLWHSHFPNRQEELASRADDAMVPKFQRTIDRALAAGATIAVFGHWHIPLIYEQSNVTVINPGALASGNFFTRQLRPSVALLYLFNDGTHQVIHIDPTQPATPFIPACQWPAGFKATLAHYSEEILSPALEATLQRIRPTLSNELRQALILIILPLAQRCWRGEQDVITHAALAEHMATDQTLTPQLQKEIRMLLFL